MLATSKGVHLERLFLPPGAAVCEWLSVCCANLFIVAFRLCLCSCQLLLSIIHYIRSLRVFWMPAISKGVLLESLFLPLGATMCEWLSVCCANLIIGAFRLCLCSYQVLLSITNSFSCLIV